MKNGVVIHKDFDGIDRREWCKVIGNSDYSISKKLKIRYDGLGEPSIKIDDDMVTIALYNNIITVTKTWLRVVSITCRFILKPYQCYINNIVIHKVNPKIETDTNDEYIIGYKEPVTIMHDNIEFRLLARYPNYAVSRYGDMLRVSSKRIRYIVSSIEECKINNSEVYMYLTDQHDGRSGAILVKRLIAYEWLKIKWYNNDCNYIIHNKNGKRYDIQPSNLEWMTMYGVNKLELDNKPGLSRPVTVRNLDTGDISTYASITKMTNAFGISRINMVVNPPYKERIYRDINGNMYEMKYANDTREWFYEHVNYRITKNQKTLIELQYPDKDTIYVGSLKEFQDVVFNGVKSADTIKSALKVAKKRYPELVVKIHYLDQYHDRSASYDGYNVITKEHIHVDSVKKLIDITNIVKPLIRKSILTYGKYIVHDWVFKNSKDDWSEEVATVYNTPFIVTLTHIETNEATVYNSKIKAGKYLGVSKNAIHHGRVINKHKISIYKKTYGKITIEYK